MVGTAALELPVSSAPDRSGTGHARHGGDRSNTNPELRLRHTSNLHNELTHHVRPHVARATSGCYTPRRVESGWGQIRLLHRGQLRLAQPVPYYSWLVRVPRDEHLRRND